VKGQGAIGSERLIYCGVAAGDGTRKGAIRSKRFLGCDGVAAGGLAHPCSLLCCAGNQVSHPEASIAWIEQRLEHNKRMLCTLPLYLYMWHT